MAKENTGLADGDPHVGFFETIRQRNPVFGGEPRHHERRRRGVLRDQRDRIGSGIQVDVVARRTRRGMPAIRRGCACTGFVVLFEAFAATRPESRALFERAGESLLAGVPMQWMTRWPGTFPIFVAEARGARLKDVDGLDYIDLCSGIPGQ